jgi:O-antigen ligase
VTLLPLLYFGVVKGRSISHGLWALPPAIMACWCLWSTQSKGAYLVGALLIVFSVLLGRPWWLKISIILLALAMGSTALSVLPRMNEMGKLRNDEGVVGRLLAWEMARNVTRTATTGEGYMGFNANIRWEGKVIPKATHSAYVQTGGDLGLPGLLLYLSALCCGLRTMIVYYGVNKKMDRVRGALFALLLGYMASGWMINRSYHLEFFLILAAIAAYQRLCLRSLASKAAPVKEEAKAAPTKDPFLTWRRKRVVNTPMNSEATMMRRFGKWRRYGLLDAGFAFATLQVVLAIWDYVLTNL